MDVLVYGLKNCDSCRKARKWLDAKGVAHEFIDLRDETPSVSTLKAWHQAVGDGLLNRRGTTWRQLPEIEKAKAEMKDELPALLHEHPALVKRPVLVTSEKMLVGFDKTRWKQAL